MKNALISPQGPQNFLKAPLRGGVRYAHGAARTERPPVSTDRARTAKSPMFWIFLQILPSKSPRRLVVACGGMRRLLEWSLGAASDGHEPWTAGCPCGSGNQRREISVSPQCRRNPNFCGLVARSLTITARSPVAGSTWFICLLLMPKPHLRCQSSGPARRSCPRHVDHLPARRHS